MAFEFFTDDSLTRGSQQVMRLLCGYITATHFYAHKMALTAIVAQAQN
jgi:hypothetical protein